MTGSITANSLYDLAGLVAVVTGGGTGIGLMITRTLAANGAKVYIIGRRLEVLQTAASEHGQNNNIIPIQLDLTIKDEVLRTAGDIESKEPNGIHILVNNAGVTKDKATTDFSVKGPPDFKSAVSISENMLRSTPESWAEMFETNVTAAFFTAAAFIPSLAKGTASRPGYSASVVNIASIAALARFPWGGWWGYTFSKAAMLHFSRVLGTTLAQAKVRVNTIAPGPFPSEMTDDTPHLDSICDTVPVGRLGNEQEIANAILYLVGPASTYVNGQTLYPDGGVVLTQPANVS